MILKQNASWFLLKNQNQNFHNTSKSGHILHFLNVALWRRNNNKNSGFIVRFIVQRPY